MTRYGAWTLITDPIGLSLIQKNCLYEVDSLRTLSAILSDNGVISFWSASSSSCFLTRLKQIFKQVTEITVPMKRGEPDYIYMARN